MNNPYFIALLKLILKAIPVNRFPTNKSFIFLVPNKPTNQLHSLPKENYLLESLLPLTYS